MPNRISDSPAGRRVRVISARPARAEGSTPPTPRVSSGDAFDGAAGARPAPAVHPQPRPDDQLKLPRLSLLDTRRLGDARDELVDKRGYLRPQYRAVLPLLARLTPERLETAVISSLHAFEGDNAQHPIPRVLTEHEVRTLTRGVTQRGTALRMLLEDYYSGKKSYTSVVSEEVVHAIVRRSNEQWYEGAVDPKHIAFPYGPDIMRAPNGKFMVIEDNAGFIGGPGDLALARKLLFQLAPELESRLRPVDDPKAYYKALVEHARAHAVPAGGEVIMVTDPNSAADNEDKRVSELLSAEGVTVVSPRSHPRMVAGKDGVFLRGEHGQPPRQVGYVFVLGEHRWMDASHPTTRAALLVEEAAEALEDPEVKLEARERAALQARLDEVHAGSNDVSKLNQAMRSLDLVNRGMLRANSPAKGVMDAYYAGKVAMNYVPGVDFVGDKELKSYVDDLVRHYLKEEPLLPSIPVERFGVREVSGEVRLDEDLLHRVLDDGAHRDWVFKVVDGRGGKGVYIGPKMSEEDRQELLAQIRSDPSRWVVEPYTTPSTLSGHIVDLRMVSQVTPDGVIVSPTPWGRGVPIEGDGKVNLSQAGREFAVAVVPDPPVHVWVKGESGLKRLTLRRRPIDAAPSPPAVDQTMAPPPVDVRSSLASLTAEQRERLGPRSIGEWMSLAASLGAGRRQGE